MPFAGTIGKFVVSTASELGTVNQLVPMPCATVLVCTCRFHPRWFAGHERYRSPPETLKVIFVGFVATPVTTLKTPFAELKLQARPGPGLPAMALKLPECVPALKIVKLSLVDKVPEIFVAINVPA